MDTWQRVAEEALKRDREDLARAALHRKVAAQKKSEDLTRQLAELVDVQLTLERNRQVSEQRG
jgi:phage shock protein A